MTMATDEIRFGRKRNFFQSYRPWNTEISSSAKLVYVYLNDRGGSNDRAWPSVATIAKDTGLKDRTVQYATKELNETGLVVKVARHRENRSQTSNLYIIFPTEEPFNWDTEEIDNKGIVSKKQNTISSGANNAPQYIDKGMQIMHPPGANNAPPEHIQVNNTNVVVVENNDLKKLDESKNEEPVFDQNKSREKSKTTNSPAAAPIPLADINRVIDAVKEVTGCVIKEQDAKSLLSRWPVDYVLTKINVAAGKKITKNVVGWIMSCCDRDWVNVVKPGKVKNVRSENRPYNDGNNSASAAAAAKKAMLMDYLYQSK